jgi:dihydroorotase-like cyclic amidohydrolase
LQVIDLSVDIVIKNGRLLLPAGLTEASLIIDKGKIVGFSKSSEPQASKLIDAKEKVVLPGMIDMHVHLRDPGFPERENLICLTRFLLSLR